MPQDDGTSIPFDISVTACIPSVYDHILLLMEQFGIDLLDTRFSYSVKYQGRIYAHDFDSEIREQLQPEIAKFQRLLRRLQWFGWLSRSQSKALNALNPFNYISMGTVLNLGGFSGDFRYKILKPMFVNFLMATNVFDSQETCFVTGLAAATQLGADYPFDDPAAKRSFNFYGSILHGSRLHKIA